MRRAVIDVGSNSVLLVVAERQEDGWRPIYEDTSVTALGEGTRATGVLGEAGMTATLEALHRFYRAAYEHGAEEVCAAATMAARIAVNSNDFQARARAQGTPVSILSGEDEARLGFLSVAEDPMVGGVGRISIIDPGGHSTELATADHTDSGWQVRFQRSYPVGTLGLRSSHFAGERLSRGEILRGMAYVDDLIGLCYRPGQAGAAVVLGASGTNLICVRDRVLEWDPVRVHGAILGYEDVSKMFGWMAELTDSERAAIPGLERGREKTIHLGALILERFLFALRAEECRVSVRGWRHALLEHPVQGCIFRKESGAGAEK